MNTNNNFGRVLCLVLIQLTITSLVVSIPAQKPDGNSINVNYLGSADGKSFFAEMTPTRSWAAAKLYCEQSGMHLASLTSSSQVALIVRAYNSVTFAGSIWTGGRDARAASQFVWDNTGAMLDKNILEFDTINAMQTCVFWHVSTASNCHVDSGLCTRLMGVICEINA